MALDARLGDPLRDDRRYSALHAVQVLEDLGYRPPVLGWAELPVVVRDRGCCVEQIAALLRQILENLGKSRMHHRGKRPLEAARAHHTSQPGDVRHLMAWGCRSLIDPRSAARSRAAPRECPRPVAAARLPRLP